jgi:hypothetical protein
MACISGNIEHGELPGAETQQAKTIHNTNEAEGYWAGPTRRFAWLEESDPAGVILYEMDGPYRLSFPYRTVCSDRS